MKACLLKQGWTPDQLKQRLGHNLEKIYGELDKAQFGEIIPSNADDVVPMLNLYHQCRFNFYPSRGVIHMIELSELDASSNSLRLSRHRAVALFGLPV